MEQRIYNFKFQNKDRLKSHYVYKLQNKVIPNDFHFLTDEVICPILDQESLGSCVANGAYVLFYIISDQKITLSRLKLYYISR